MATYYSGYSNEYVLRLDIAQGTQSVTNNTSVVSWTLYLHSGNKSMSVYSTYHATVNGVAAPNTTQTNVNIGFNSSVNLGSGSTTVTHNSDGTKSVAFSASFKTNSAVYAGGVLITPGTMTISGTFALTTIPRYAAITAFTASINDRVATLSWTADKTISQWRWSSNSGSSYSGWITVNASSGSITRTDAVPGSTYGFRIQVINSASGLITTSSVVSKTATKTASTLTLSTTSQNVGSGITWTVNESYDYTHKITYAFGNTSGYILGSSSAASNTATGTWTVPTALANQIPNATSGSGTIYVYTYYGSVHVGTKSYTFTAKVPNNTTWQPTIPNVTITDAGSRPTGITSYVQGKAKAKVVSSSAAQGGASISSYRVTVGGIGTYYGANITSGYLTSSGTVTITVRATDSRGYYREKSNTVTVVAYSPPKLTAYTALRSPNDQGTDLATSINFSISSVGDQNTKQYRIRYRPTGGTWVGLVDSTAYYTRSTTHSATGVLDANSSYQVEFYIKDSYTSVTQTRNIGTAFQLLDFNASGRGVAFGKVSEKKALEVALPVEFNSVDFTMPNGRRAVYILNTADLNNVVEEWTLGSNGSNFPSSGYWYVHTIMYSDLNQRKQIAYGYNSNDVYTRYVYQGAWSAWVKTNGVSSVAWADVSSKPAQATRWPTWAEVTSKPSTFAPSSHTHSYLSNSYLQNHSLSNANSADVAGVTAYYLTSSASNRPPGTDHSLLTLSYGDTWSTQLASDWRTNEWYVRNQNTGTWGSWRNLWHSGNSYGSNGENGYLRLGNGQIIQWGSMVSTANLTAKAFTFPTAFPSYCYIVILQPTSHYGTTYRVSAKSRTGATIEHALSNTLAAVAAVVTYKWIAIGV